MLGGTSALVSLIFSGATPTKANAIKAEEGKPCLPLHLLEHGNRGDGSQQIR